MFMTSLTLTNSQGTLAFFLEWWGPEKNVPGSIGGILFERRCPFWVCVHQISRAYYYRDDEMKLLKNNMGDFLWLCL